MKRLTTIKDLGDDWFFWWMVEHWKISSGEHVGENYAFWPNYYFMEAYAKDNSRRKVSLKCAQVGMSEISIAEMFAVCDKLPGNAMYVFPTDTIAQEFSRARLTNAHRINPYLEERMTGFDTLRQFKFGKNYIYIRGASVQQRDGREYRRQLITVDASRLFGDEVDEWSPGVFGSLQSRVGASSDPTERYLSVPRLSDGGISKLYGMSDKKVWMIKCRSCNERQELQFEVNVTNFEYPDLENKIICRKCGKDLDRTESDPRFCSWVAQETEIKRNYSGYHFSKLFFPNSDINVIVERYNDPETIQDCYNDDLGLPYEPSSAKIGDSELKRCSVPLNMSGYWESLMESIDYKVIGVDIGKKINYVVRGVITHFEGREVKLSPYVDFGRVDSLEDIKEIIVHHQVRAGIFDAQPEFDSTSSFCESLENSSLGTFRVAYFDTTTLERLLLRYDNQNPIIVHIGRNLGMGKILREFLVKEAILPHDYQYVDQGKFVEEMKVPVRIFRKNGKTGQIEGFFPKSRKPDHYFMSAMYSYCAMDLTPDECVIGSRGLI